MAVKPLLSDDSDKEKKIKEIIDKGGKSSSDIDADKWIMISLRMPKSLLTGIDKRRSERIGMNRNSWILEALQEKLRG